MTLEEMKERKEKRGYSLAQLSKYSGIPLGTVQKVFSGASVHPRKATLDALEKVLLGEETLYQGKSMSYEKSSRTYQTDLKPESSQVAESTPEYGHKRQNEYTVADYFALPDDQRAELIDGVFYDMATPLFVHQDILGYVFAEIYNYIRAHHGSCKVIASPSAVQLCCDDKTMVEPDLYIVCDQAKVRRFGIYGAPDFVLEILSQSTRKKDMNIKLYKYCEAGVKEYWIIDPVKQVLITYDFTDPEYLPKVTALQGEAGISLYKGELKISLSEIAQIIREAEERE